MSDPDVPVEEPHDEDAGGDHGHVFDINASIMSHNLPYPAIEPVHGAPLLVFDRGAYAAINFEALSHTEAFAEAEPSTDMRAWAEDVIERPDFRYDAAEFDAGSLAQAMVAVPGVVLPRPLSWLNQQLFWGTGALILLTVFLCGVKRRRVEEHRPSGRFQHAVEAIVLYLREEVVRPSFHDAANRWTPFFASMFLVILTVNLFGLIPGTGTLSGNIGATISFALVTLFCMLYFGMKEQGPKFWINLVPIPFSWGMSPIWVLLLAIELLGLVIKPSALALRLGANMFGGHTVLLIFLTLGYVVFAQTQSVGLAIALQGFGFILGTLFHLMEVLVAFVQAYVFTLLSAIFIGMSIHPEH